ncbi:MAG: TlpA family protein disulfide reductase [Gracilibacteraceae bacterium]|jgi:peroxiredoxin|nr:TlpA family protein disulfide reductase [Gracilibacteraceae bacterium]
MNKILLRAAVLLLLTLLAGCAAGTVGNAGGSPGAEAGGSPGGAEAAIGLAVGQTAPDFTLTLNGGGEVTLSQLRGQPVFLNLFTTWCPPCREEIPALQKIYEEYGDRVSIIGVSVTESADVVAEFIAASGVGYPVALDPDGIVAADYDVQFIPQSWVLDSDGVIADYIPGGTDEAGILAALAGVLP